MKAHFLSPCKNCRLEHCPEAIKTDGTKWYITQGHPAFYNEANVRFGYGTEASARNALRYGLRHTKSRWGAISPQLNIPARNTVEEE